jgi:hypothetical protein
MRKKSKEEPSKNDVESVYYDEITYVCPKRGKVTEKVKVKRLSTQKSPDRLPPYELEILKIDSEE